MTAIIEKKMYSEEERIVFKAKREEFKNAIKVLEKEQKEDKTILHMNHREYCKEHGMWSISSIMSMVSYRKDKISRLLIEYKKFLSKPYNMHEKKIN